MSGPLRSTGDLLVALAWTVAAGAVVLSGYPSGVLRTLLTVPLIILLPGYALVAALFPDAHGTDTSGDTASTGITGAERFGLAVVMSVVLVPMAGFVVNYTTGLYLRPLLLAVGGVTGFLALVGILRRLALPAERRHGLAIGTWLDDSVGEFLAVTRRRHP